MSKKVNLFLLALLYCPSEALTICVYRVGRRDGSVLTSAKNIFDRKANIHSMVQLSIKRISGVHQMVNWVKAINDELTQAVVRI